MDTTDRRVLSVRFHDEIIVISPREDVKKGESRTVITELGRSDEEHGCQHWQCPLHNRNLKRHKGPGDIAILLAFLCATLLCFIIGVVGWAIDNPRDLCSKAPRLAMFFNRLLVAMLTAIPGLIIGLLLVWSSTRGESIECRFERGWTKLRLVLMMVVVALVTVVVMLWAWDLESWSYQVDCSEFRY